MSDVELRAVHKVFRTRGRPEVEAVRGLDLLVNSGELVGLLGPSGCGKSTTLRMIAGLEQPTSGDVLIGGRNVGGLPPQRRNVGVAFENYALYPPLSVTENLAFGLAARKIPNRDARVREVAERIGLTDILPARPSALSSGQKQRVALARALVRDPEVLLLDEPLSHLDAAQRDATRRELKRLQLELGYTTILVTHDQEEALSVADRLVVMDEGQVQQIGRPDEVYEDPANLFVADFVGEPAMNLLPGTVDGGVCRLGEAVTVPLRIAVRSPGEVHVGVRPEDVRLGPVGEGFTARCLVYEDVLEYGLATLAVPGVDQRLVAQTTPGLAISPDEEVGVSFVAERTYCFDAASGGRIR